MPRKRAIKSVSDDRSPGLVCPRCWCAHLPVVYTRERDGYVQRVRECRHCGRRMVTRETVAGVRPGRKRT